MSDKKVQTSSFIIGSFSYFTFLLFLKSGAGIYKIYFDFGTKIIPLHFITYPLILLMPFIASPIIFALVAKLLKVKVFTVWIVLGNLLTVVVLNLIYFLYLLL